MPTLTCNSDGLGITHQSLRCCHCTSKCFILTCLGSGMGTIGSRTGRQQWWSYFTEASTGCKKGWCSDNMQYCSGFNWMRCDSEGSGWCDKMKLRWWRWKSGQPLQHFMISMVSWLVVAGTAEKIWHRNHYNEGNGIWGSGVVGRRLGDISSFKAGFQSCLVE